MEVYDSMSKNPRICQIGSGLKLSCASFRQILWVYSGFWLPKDKSLGKSCFGMLGLLEKRKVFHLFIIYQIENKGYRERCSYMLYTWPNGQYSTIDGSWTQG